MSASLSVKPILKTLKNGLRILLIPQPQAATATALILVATGSKYENKATSGLSHFLEHMFFKGTTKRPSAKNICETLDEIGSISNAFTSQEYTGYYAKGSPQHVDKYLDVLSDIYLDSTFPEGEIAKEKGVIIEEINMYEDMPQHKVGQALVTLMYGDQPAGWPIIGTKENVLAFSRKDFIDYHHLHYHADNTIIVLAGAIDPQHAVEQVKKYFSRISVSKKVSKKKVVVTQKALALRVIEKQSDQAHLAIGFRSLPYGHKDAPALSLLATLLGRGMSSRLFQTVREEMGAAYYVHADQESSTDTGLFSISAGIDKTRLNEILLALARELSLIKTTLVTDKELTKAKEYTFGMMRLGLESSDDIAGFYGTQLLLKRELKTPSQVMKEYARVESKDIQRVAKKVFVAKNTNIALIGPYTNSDVDTATFRAL